LYNAFIIIKGYKILLFLEERAHLSSKVFSVASETIENEYIRQYNTFIKEIPPNFLSFYNKRTKREEVTNHLKKIYNIESVNNDDVECVVKRVINIARVANASNRSDYENRLLQEEYKKNNWDKIKRCEICGKRFLRKDKASLEHVLPLSLGGDDNETNWQLLCKRCNNDKSSLFGITSVDRVRLMVTDKIFKYRTIEEQILAVPKNYRYLVMERDKRSCSDCSNTCRSIELYVTINSRDEIVHFDNLYTLCKNCITSKSILEKYIMKDN